MTPMTLKWITKQAIVLGRTFWMVWNWVTFDSSTAWKPMVFSVDSSVFDCTLTFLRLSPRHVASKRLPGLHTERRNGTAIGTSDISLKSSDYFIQPFFVFFFFVYVSKFYKIDAENSTNDREMNSRKKQTEWSSHINIFKVNIMWNRF